MTRRGSIAAVGGVLMALLVCAAAAPAEPPRIRVGSKSFTESYILAEMVAQIVDETGEARAERRLGLGGTGIVYGALASGDIDIYPEYTGTIAQAILKEPTLASASTTPMPSPSGATRRRAWACARSAISRAIPGCGRPSTPASSTAGTAGRGSSVSTACASPRCAPWSTRSRIPRS